MLGFPSKVVPEIIQAKFDFFSYIPFGEVISAPVVTVTVFQGFDDDPSDILQGIPSIPVAAPEMVIQEELSMHFGAKSTG
jgi:hypothetical protein